MYDEVDKPFPQSKEFAAIIAKTRSVFKDSFKACVDKVKAIDQDKKAWLDMVNAPVVLAGQPNSTFFRYDHYTSRVRAALHDAQSYLVGADAE